MEYATQMGRDQLALFRRIVTDPDRTARLGKHLCVLCHYRPRIGGAAITGANCGGCGVEMLFGNTNVDVLCGDCAAQRGACRHCGADLHLRGRRKLVKK